MKMSGQLVKKKIRENQKKKSKRKNEKPTVHGSIVSLVEDKSFGKDMRD